MIHIYILKDPITKIVRYVGATSNPKSRFSQHIRDSKKKKKTAKTEKQKWIMGLSEKGLLPLIEIVGTATTKPDARKTEEETVIKYIDTVYNIHMPGKGSLSVAHYRQTGTIK